VNPPEPPSGEAPVEERIYAQRFGSEERVSRRAMWSEIVRHLERYVPPDSVVLDVGADEGLFITQVTARERWAADLQDVSASFPADVRFVQASGLDLDDRLPHDHFDRIFMSNYLEHLPTGGDVIRQFQVCARLLKPGGQVIVLQPNISLVGGAYWDFIDHKVALTHRSLEEAAGLAGLRTVRTIVRYLPYTTKGRMPTAPWMVRLYLRMPLAWRVLGRQTLFIAERPR
jgi:SAM-dependent methyltransferase